MAHLTDAALWVTENGYPTNLGRSEQTQRADLAVHPARRPRLLRPAQRHRLPLLQPARQQLGRHRPVRRRRPAARRPHPQARLRRAAGRHPGHRPVTRRVKVTGGELYADVDGEGPPVVLLHSGITDARQWEQVTRLIGRRATVIRYDRRGYGRSAKYKRGRYSHALDLLELLDGLRLDRVVACGNSAGGHALLEAATLQPERFAPARPARPAAVHLDLRRALEAYGEAEEQALAAGDIDTAVRLNLDTWVHRPEHREPVATMLRRALENQPAPAVRGVRSRGPARGRAPGPRSRARSACWSASTTTRSSARSPGTSPTGWPTRPPRRSRTPATCSAWRRRSWSPLRSEACPNSAA